jgi:hypothetical protein
MLFYNINFKRRFLCCEKYEACGEDTLYDNATNEFGYAGRKEQITK